MTRSTLFERRTMVGEFRAAGDAPLIRGHAAVFNARSEDFGGWQEQIAPGAFAAALADAELDCRALWNHDPNFVLGRTKSGTLRLAEDSQGLACEIDPPDTSWCSDLLVTMRRGDVTQMSFGFCVDDEGSPGDTWHEENGIYIRTLLRVELFDVSPVTYPAYPTTDVTVRSRLLERAAAALAAKPEAEGRSIAWYRRKLRLIQAA